MHICSTRLGMQLTEIELKHLEQCDVCQFEHQLLQELRLSEINASVISPPNAVWQRIEMSLSMKDKKKEKVKRPMWQKLSLVAASTAFVGFSWLMLNNYQLQIQLEQVLQVNRSLELQIIQTQQPTFQQAQLLFEVGQIDFSLREATSTTEKVKLLNIRQQVIDEMVKLQQQGNENEISI